MDRHVGGKEIPGLHLHLRRQSMDLGSQYLGNNDGEDGWFQTSGVD